jgi:hypothetical protein
MDARQKAIVESLKNGEKVVDLPEPEVIPEGPRRYMALPGVTLVGVGRFPMVVEDPEIQKKIESCRSFQQGKIWIENRSEEESSAAENALAGLGFGQLRKLAVALGHRDINRLTKLELIEVCTREGASFL